MEPAILPEPVLPDLAELNPLPELPDLDLFAPPDVSDQYPTPLADIPLIVDALPECDH